MDALSTRGEHTDTMQQKVGRRDVTPDPFKISKYNSCNIHLKAIETLEICF
jgi:hypothetical protein